MNAFIKRVTEDYACNRLLIAIPRRGVGYLLIKLSDYGIFRPPDCLGRITAELAWCEPIVEGFDPVDLPKEVIEYLNFLYDNNSEYDNNWEIDDE